MKIKPNEPSGKDFFNFNIEIVDARDFKIAGK
jgi:hypothetical protein